MPLTVNEARDFLGGNKQPLETLNWLRDVFLPLAKNDLNSADVRRRIALYAGEMIPENERNLTDVRNRVSLIVEYELARIATRLIENLGIRDLFWSYVVANRFPDLEVRNAAGIRGLRVEVKNLQSAAEEKSANFDTLRKDVHPKSDFLVVFLWEWKHDGGEVHWDRAPQIEKIYVFHAASLAQLRDRYWLNNPPRDPGDGLQGFDLRYAVNCNQGNYNEEEGNYGKLLRLWSEGFEYVPPMTPLLERTRDDYLVFQREVVDIGFDNLAARILPELSGANGVATVLCGDKRVGWRSGNFTFVMDDRLSRDELIELIRSSGGVRVFGFTSKYVWKEYRIREEKQLIGTKLRLQTVLSGKKPKGLLTAVRAFQPVSPPQAIAAGQDES